MKFTPGPGVGGHCLPIDPSYLSWEVRRKLGRTFRFVELANEINDHMPAHVTKRAAAMLNAQRKSVAGSVILLVGLAYKKNTGDIRESPALKIIDELLEAGAEVRAADNHVEPYRWPANVAKVDLGPASLDGVDLVILLTDHDDFDLSLLETSAVSVFDAKGRLDTRLGHVARL
jgi:UDP-N-acetyl-D-mannosaminuronic acid dehydrogenase/UDP-N-acetyl-D-glucosamine dehydrogenase